MVVAGETVVVSAEIKNKNDLYQIKTSCNLHKNLTTLPFMAVDKFLAKSLPAFVVVAGETVVVSSEIKNNK